MKEMSIQGMMALTNKDEVKQKCLASIESYLVKAKEADDRNDTEAYGCYSIQVQDLLEEMNALEIVLSLEDQNRLSNNHIRRLYGRKLYHPHSDGYYKPEHVLSTRQKAWQNWCYFNNYAVNLASEITGFDVGEIECKYYNIHPEKEVIPGQNSVQMKKVFSYMATKAMFKNDEEAKSVPFGSWCTHDMVHFDLGFKMVSIAGLFRSFRLDSAGGFSVIKRVIPNSNRTSEFCLIPDCQSRTKF